MSQYLVGSRFGQHTVIRGDRRRRAETSLRRWTGGARHPTCTPMAEVTNELLYEVLKKLQEGQNNLFDRLGDVAARLGSLERQSAGLRDAVVRLDGRLDRVERRLDRIERRLELTPAE